MQHTRSQEKQIIRSIVRFAAFGLIFSPLFLFSSTTLAAQSQIGPHLGVNFDGEDFFIGGNGHFPVGSGGNTPIYLNPRVDFYLRDNITLIGMNGNFYFQFGTENSDLRFHAGGGLQILYISNNTADNFDLGINLLGGLKFSAAGIRWLTQAEISINGGTDFEVLFGPIFNL
ncbi:MAG: hypothetical protein KDD67_10485 [Ignavibacteriae bacterium]|nr:hypothetical protein [Ignavibacteriota bacterium]